jgi:hypothetical protein
MRTYPPDPDDPPRLALVVPWGIVRGGLKFDGERELFPDDPTHKAEYASSFEMWRAHGSLLRYAVEDGDAHQIHVRRSVHSGVPHSRWLRFHRG